MGTRGSPSDCLVCISTTAPSPPSATFTVLLNVVFGTAAAILRRVK